MSDEIDKMFSDLETYYPGSKRKRRETKKAEVIPDAGWDTKPIKKTMPNGKEMEFFTLVNLAGALGRPVKTLRKWLDNGYLPPSPYRSPDTTTKAGKTMRGYRLYSRAQIEAVVKLFGEAGLLDKTRIQWPNQKLTSAIAETWSHIRVLETETTKPNGEI